MGNFSDTHPFDVSNILLYLMKEELASIIDSVNIGTRERGFEVRMCERFTLNPIPHFFPSPQFNLLAFIPCFIFLAL